MTSVETELVEQRGRDTTMGQISRAIRKRKRCTRRIKRLPPPPPASSDLLQRLYDSCRFVFKGAGVVPPPCDVEKLCRILDGMRPEDVGLSKDLQFFKPSCAIKTHPRVTKTTIYECKNFSLCIFFMPANAVIPLHNHPEMTVFSKLLLGTMHIKSFDWVDQNGSVGSDPSSRRRLAKLEADELYTAPCDTSVLYPTTGGNMHQFTAVTPCAVLDVIGPPYSTDEGRDCTFYREFPCESPQNDMEKEGVAYAWLEEIDDPEESEMNEVEYMGPQITEFRC
uniref:cysteine dioxygenase n=1 Tax=Kalanchoe fedtschenkoi TaxID=63787 RepID=A0A7N0SWX7_KALFE